MSKVFYASQSWWGSSGANFIQVSCMVRGFAKHASCVDVVFRDRGDIYEANDWPENARVWLLPCAQNRLGRAFYSIKLFFKFIKLTNKQPYSLVFSRSIIFVLLVCVFTKNKVVLELHAGIKSYFHKLALSRIIKNGGSIVCISEALKKHVVSSVSIPNDIYVLHDAHSNEVVEPCGSIPVNDDNVFNLGYFGGITEQKGQRFLQELVKLEGLEDVRINIYSKDYKKIKAGPLLGELTQLKHEECYSKMLEQHALLLLVEPMGTRADISPYTSPLKLFEYLSTGRPIISSNLPILKEILEDDLTALLVEHNAESFSEAISKLKGDHKLYSNLSSNGLELSKKYTWESRVKFILDKEGV